jgi:hypothetical protein
MLRRISICSIILFSLSAHIHAQNNTGSPLAAAKAWWHAVTFGDTNYIKNNSTEKLTVTFNNGQSFTHQEIIVRVGTHNPLAKIAIEWSDITEQKPHPNTTIVTNRIEEKVGPMTHVYKFITVLVKAGSGWSVAAAQSTRELALALRISIMEAGNPEDYAGAYRTPAGMTLELVMKDTSLMMVEPSGAETKLEAIGHDLFELSTMPFAGNVRFAFVRDAQGKVKSLTRIAHVITAMPRIR